MLTLIIDTSEAQMLVILAENETSLVVMESNQMPLAVLHTMIQGCIQSQQRTLNNLGLIAVVLGSESWTGLNIGVTAAKTLAQVLNVPLLPLTSFDAYAIQHTEAGIFYVCLDARRSMLYTRQYKRDMQGNSVQQGQMELLRIDALCERIQSENIPVFLTGPGATIYKESIERECAALAQCIPHPERNLVQLAWEKRAEALPGIALFDIAPLYGQSATAVERTAQS